MEFPKDPSLVHSFFLSNIKDLLTAIKFSTLHRFADDTNLLISNKSIKTVQTQIKLDLKYSANKISLNANKTKVLIFRHQNKPLCICKCF